MGIVRNQIENNRETITNTVTTDAESVPVVDNLTSTSTTNPLSANQGKGLQDNKAGKDTVNTFTKGQVGEITTLTSGSNVAIDLGYSNNYKLTLGTSAILDNPTNVIAGQSGLIEMIQDATGSRTITFGTEYVFAGGSPVELTTTASARDILAYYVMSNNKILVSISGEIS